MGVLLQPGEAEPLVAPVLPEVAVHRIVLREKEAHSPSLKVPSVEEMYHVLLRDGTHAFDVDVDDDLGRVACEIYHEELNISSSVDKWDLRFWNPRNSDRV